MPQILKEAKIFKNFVQNYSIRLGRIILQKFKQTLNLGKEDCYYLSN